MTVDPFEIGSHTGFITKPIKKRLGSIHKFCKKSIKLKSFINNISAITVMPLSLTSNLIIQIFIQEETKLVTRRKP